jgi:hypothetical protein
LAIRTTDVPAGEVVAERQVAYRLPVKTGTELQAYLQADKSDGRTLAHLRLMSVKNGKEAFTRSGIHVELEQLPELLLATAMLLVAANGQEENRG